ncbi:hypothetical protein GCM10010378_45790 [Streptomyces viridochromogenes]
MPVDGQLCPWARRLAQAPRSHTVARDPFRHKSFHSRTEAVSGVFKKSWHLASIYRLQSR